MQPRWGERDLHVHATYISDLIMAGIDGGVVGEHCSAMIAMCINTAGLESDGNR